MTTTSTPIPSGPPARTSKVTGHDLRSILTKVPEVTLAFWAIKVLATTVGETFADFLATKFGLGLTGLTIIMGAALAVALVFQFRARQYVPWKYWLSVVLISVVGTLITDKLVDDLGVSLWACTVGFGLAMIAAFGAWYASERTLSIHSIDTTKREAFYWLAILFTFALGTAAGDLLAEGLNIGYFNSVLMFIAMIGLVAIAWRSLNLNAIAAFWMVYILTRPLGASTGDLLSQDKVDGGLGLGTTVTSLIFLSAILGLVIYLTSVQRRASAVGTTAVTALRAP
jgi:uncharacterized membrane-anchored protein